MLCRIFRNWTFGQPDFDGGAGGLDVMALTHMEASQTFRVSMLTAAHCVLLLSIQFADVLLC